MKKRITHILSSVALMTAMLTTPVALFAQANDGGDAVVIGDTPAATELPTTGATPEAAPNTGFAPSGNNLAQGLTVFGMGATIGTVLGGAFLLVRRQQTSKN